MLLASLLTLTALPMPPAAPQDAPRHPDFTLPTVDGEMGSLTEYRGRKTVVIHFASW